MSSKKSRADVSKRLAHDINEKRPGFLARRDIDKRYEE
jgi:hypothetical protein